MEILIHFAVGFMLVIMSLSIHEFAHARAAYHFGDYTAKREGRMTINPIKHIDLVGTIILPIVLTLLIGIGFGWAKPVPVNANVLGKKKMAWVAFAGPASNFLIALVCVNLFYILRSQMPYDSSLSILGSVAEVLLVAIKMNIALGLFNLIPLIPLDGGRILGAFMSYTSYYKFSQFMERYGMIVMFVLVVSPFFKFFNVLVNTVTNGVLSF